MQTNECCNNLKQIAAKMNLCLTIHQAMKYSPCSIYFSLLADPHNFSPSNCSCQYQFQTVIATSCCISIGCYQISSKDTYPVLFIFLIYFCVNLRQTVAHKLNPSVSVGGMFQIFIFWLC